MALGGCVPEQGEGSFDDQTIDVGVDDAQAVELGGGRGADTMTGTWLLAHEQSNCVQIPGVPDPDEALSVTFEIVHFEQVGNRLYEDRDLCSLNLFPLLSFDTEFTPAAAQTTNPILIEDSFISNYDVGGSYASGVEVQQWGVMLDDPLADEFPTEADDPRVFDADDDGNPGVTFVVAQSCEMYVAQRGAIRYRGLLERPNQIVGESSTIINQLIVGSSSPICAIPRTITPNDAHGRFTLSRIDGEGGSVNLDANGDGEILCDEIIAIQDQLWDYREPDASLCGG